MNAIPTTVNSTNVKAPSFFNEKVQTNTDHTAAYDCSLLQHGDDDLSGTSNASSKTTAGAIAATTLPSITTAATAQQKSHNKPPLSPLVVPKSKFVDLTTTTDNHEDHYHDGDSPSASMNSDEYKMLQLEFAHDRTAELISQHQDFPYLLNCVNTIKRDRQNISKISRSSITPSPSQGTPGCRLGPDDVLHDVGALEDRYYNNLRNKEKPLLLRGISPRIDKLIDTCLLVLKNEWVRLIEISKQVSSTFNAPRILSQQPPPYAAANMMFRPIPEARYRHTEYNSGNSIRASPVVANESHLNQDDTQSFVGGECPTQTYHEPDHQTAAAEQKPWYDAGVDVKEGDAQGFTDRGHEQQTMMEETNLLDPDDCNDHGMEYDLFPWYDNCEFSARDDDMQDFDAVVQRDQNMGSFSLDVNVDRCQGHELQTMATEQNMLDSDDCSDFGMEYGCEQSEGDRDGFDSQECPIQKMNSHVLSETSNFCEGYGQKTTAAQQNLFYGGNDSGYDPMTASTPTAIKNLNSEVYAFGRRRQQQHAENSRYAIMDTPSPGGGLFGGISDTPPSFKDVFDTTPICGHEEYKEDYAGGDYDAILKGLPSLEEFNIDEISASGTGKKRKLSQSVESPLESLFEARKRKARTSFLCTSAILCENDFVQNLQKWAQDMGLGD